FEFLPHDDSSPTTLSRDSPPPKLVDLADVEIGKSYELIISTYSGLCRYRVGDILQIKQMNQSFRKRLKTLLNC
ncbi:putative indole-3-acetic acid-amido synthetase GH3.1-like, partial [Trifolium medium]|nr:putative indole-3-acetic acid-amido synthetase GH3.1-like [Trifolium medium]